MKDGVAGEELQQSRETTGAADRNGTESRQNDESVSAVWLLHRCAGCSYLLGFSVCFHLSFSLLLQVCDRCI